MTALRFAVGESSAAQIMLHLRICAPRFVPPLDGRVDIADYAARLAVRAERFECWFAARLVGLVAIYSNAPDVGVAFVSNVSVDPGFARRGIAEHLLTQAIDHARGRGFSRVALEVCRNAGSAVALYEKLGFTGSPKADQPTMLTMELAVT